MKTRYFLFLPLSLLSACASQSDMSYVQGQVSQLKQESQVIKQQSAGSYSEMTQYREEIASLHGKIDELHHAYRGSVKRFDMEDSLLVRKTDDLENRLAKIEQYLALESAGSDKPALPNSVQPAVPSADKATTQAKGGASPAPPPSTAAADDSLLNEGLVRMKKGDNEGARENFEAFIKANPKSPKVADAEFYVAESYFNEKWYEKAALEYDVFVRKYTKSPKRPAALYKEGLSIEKIGDTEDAKKRYQDVVNLYPKSPEAKLAQKRLGKK
jgi:tol-pal system protein YbgF